MRRRESDFKGCGHNNRNSVMLEDPETSRDYWCNIEVPARIEGGQSGRAC